MMPPIDRERACDQCPAVRQAHMKASRRHEYGINWFEFIETDESVDNLLSAWWDSLTTERRHEFIDEAIGCCEHKLEELRKARCRF